MELLRVYPEAMCGDYTLSRESCKEGAFMAIEFLKGRREIRGFPGERVWAMCIAGEPRIPYMTVRGLESDCTHPYGNTCLKCEEETPVFFRVLGAFNPDFRGGRYIFWAIISTHRNSLFDIQDNFDWTKHLIPPATQLVYGWVAPKSNSTMKGWVAPCSMDLAALTRAFYNECKPAEQAAK